MKVSIRRTASAVLVVGAAALFSAPTFDGRASPGRAAPALSFTVKPLVQTPIEIKTLPGALCTVHGQGAPANSFVTAPSDSDGIARIFVQPAKASNQVVRFDVACKTAQKSAAYTLALRAAAVPTREMPLPAQTAQPMPKGAYLRPALSPTQAASLSASELIRRGYPPLPDAGSDPAMRKAWLRAVSVPTIVLPPQTIANPYRSGALPASTATSPIWSGMAQRGNIGSFALVEGDWVVPSVRPKGDAFSNTASAEWIGIDGEFKGADLVQAGSEQETQDTFWFMSTSYWLWTQFLPQQKYSQIISGISIQPGDEIFTEVWVGAADGTLNLAGPFGVFLVQSTRGGTAVATTILTPVGTTVVRGRQADWIMERPSGCDILGSCSPMELANFGFATMTSAFAGAPRPPGGATLCCQNDPINITMMNGPNTLGTAAVVDNITLEFDWVNYQ